MAKRFTLKRSSDGAHHELCDEDQGKMIGEISEDELRKYAENHLGYPPADRAATARAKLDQLTEAYAREHGVGLSIALSNVLNTKEAQRLWEEIRSDELQQSSKRGRR